ncbi:unnamed protein product [Brachionus calyciflorus]|uniref:Cystatin domain-containing protein n=1 Tax=Brachionus calyciflorus TaxID=104777 RepID=A0A814I4D2_9BILA|nr:unnamed protein product [Brachionus calyciflorus]
MLKFILIFILASIVKCQSGLVGGRQEVDLAKIKPEELETLNKMANFGISEIAERRVESNGKKVKLSLVRLTKAQRQIVAGVNYFLTVRIKPESCQNDCDVETCDMTVWSKPWENFTELTEFNCKKSHSSYGSNIRIDKNDKYALKALDFAVDKLNQKSNDLYKQKVESVDKVYRQIVNGMKYTFICKLAKTECPKNSKDNLSLQDCAVNSKAPKKSVKITVVDKPWMNEERFELKSSIFF